MNSSTDTTAVPTSDVGHRLATSHKAKGLLEGPTFQYRVQPWLLECFGAAIAGDTIERSNRFLEEAIELYQSANLTRGDAHQLVDYVFDRPIGKKPQEVGGVMLTLAAFCLAHNLDMHECGEVELARVWTKVEQIRAKQAAKPQNSPLPMHVGADVTLSPTSPAAGAPNIDQLADLLREVQRNYTRDDDLPDNLLPRIDQTLESLDEADAAKYRQPRAGLPAAPTIPAALVER